VEETSLSGLQDFEECGKEILFISSRTGPKNNSLRKRSRPNVSKHHSFERRISPALWGEMYGKRGIYAGEAGSKEGKREVEKTRGGID